MSERSESTLGYERLSQPLFKLDEGAFVREILESVPPMPSYYPRMKAVNSKGAPSIASLPSGNALSPARVAELLPDETVTLIDLRPPEAFGGAHIPGAVNIGKGQNLSLWAGWLLAPQQRLLLVNDQGDDEEARRSLARWGSITSRDSCRKACPGGSARERILREHCSSQRKRLRSGAPGSKFLTCAAAGNGQAATLCELNWLLR